MVYCKNSICTLAFLLVMSGSNLFGQINVPSVRTGEFLEGEAKIEVLPSMPEQDLAPVGRVVVDHSFFAPVDFGYSSKQESNESQALSTAGLDQESIDRPQIEQLGSNLPPLLPMLNMDDTTFDSQLRKIGYLQAENEGQMMIEPPALAETKLRGRESFNQRVSHVAIENDIRFVTDLAATEDEEGKVVVRIGVPQLVEKIEVVHGNQSKRLSFDLKNGQGIKQPPRDLAFNLQPVVQPPVMFKPQVSPSLSKAVGGGVASANTSFQSNPFFDPQVHNGVKVKLTSGVGTGHTAPETIGSEPMLSDEPLEYYELARENKVGTLSSVAPPAQMEQAGSGASEAPVSDGIVLEFSGPKTVSVTDNADFEIVVRNEKGTDEPPFEVRLSLPLGMHVLVMDKAGLYDPKYHTLTWQVGQLKAHDSVSFQYRAKAQGAGKHTQAVEFGRNGKYSSLTTMSLRTESARQTSSK